MKKAPYLLLLFLIVPLFGHASAYWMEIKGTGKLREEVEIRIYYGNINESGQRIAQRGAELALTGEFRIRARNGNGPLFTIPISLKGDCWSGTFTPEKEGVYQILGINDTHPVVDRSKTGGKNVRPVDYLCAAYQVGVVPASSEPLQFLDITTLMEGKRVLVKAFNQAKPAAEGTKLRVFNPENWEKELLVNGQGQAVFQTSIKGLYIIRQDWSDPRPGTYKGIAYQQVRHRCNYFLLLQ
ncbi:hypothetical protein [Pedobacter nutrimenti]|jgi:hypothetical protein|uniref:DUF4198 domain-containing protein n=1 Tax=Pedobacter nutrimenti TaxID=1241337 RepID=A0A318UH89_9SPHI|nr:hypothetical protein [Pedobacter nutrimenti]PYF74900.1 hypothetical protein B0O44_103346 [Pedobacter nutrimenti]